MFSTSWTTFATCLYLFLPCVLRRAWIATLRAVEGYGLDSPDKKKTKNFANNEKWCRSFSSQVCLLLCFSMLLCTMDMTQTQDFCFVSSITFLIFDFSLCIFRFFFSFLSLSFHLFVQDVSIYLLEFGQYYKVIGGKTWCENGGENDFSSCNVFVFGYPEVPIYLPLHILVRYFAFIIVRQVRLAPCCICLLHISPLLYLPHCCFLIESDSYHFAGKLCRNFHVCTRHLQLIVYMYARTLNHRLRALSICKDCSKFHTPHKI